MGAAVWITYQRVSTKDQERNGLSVPAQVELNTAYVREQGAFVAQAFTESSSATKRDRKQFDAMLAFVSGQRGPVCLVAEKTDRLYRTWEEYVQVQRLLKEHQLTIHFSKERQILHRDSPASDVLYHMMTTMFAAYYPINLSAEVKKGLRQKLLKGGWPTKPPYGYRIHEKQVVIDPERAQFVRRAYGLYATGGYSLDALRDRLVDEGLEYRLEAPRVSRAQLSDILKNPFYVGVMEWGGETYEGAHERMVSADTWARAQAAARRDGKPESMRRLSHRYGSVFRCGECGSAVVGEAKKGGRYTYYRCANNSNHGRCSQGYVSQTVIDAEVETLLRSIQFPPSIKGEIRRAVKDATRLNGATVDKEASRLAGEIARRRAQKRQIYQDKLDGLITAEEFAEKRGELDIRIELMEQRMTQVARADVGYYDLAETLLELPEMLSGRWSSADDEQKRRLLILIDSNSVLKDRKVAWRLAEPFAGMLDFDCLSSVVEGTGQNSNILAFLADHAEAIRAAASALAA